MLINYAGIIINSEAVQLDKIFTYRIPEEFKGKIKIGHKVKVPFGMGNKLIYGFVIELYDEINNIPKIKNIKSLDYSNQLFTALDLILIREMREKYLCTYIECIKTLIPTGIIKGNESKKEVLLYIGKEPYDKYNREPYVNIYNIVKENAGKYNKNALSKKFNLSLSSINTMVKHKMLNQTEKVVDRYNTREYTEYCEKVLNEEQNSAVNKILNCEEKIFCIHGVTGSGKTEIYMKLVSEMIKKDKESIILVPEISLTPQMVERFKGRFGKDITVFHSKLSDGERYDEWFRVKQGKVKVAIGARSAIFLPFNNLGLIVIDEEHENSYKSDSNPKYNARDIAEIKSKLQGCKVILGSATPSIETYYRCLNKEIKLITIKNRADGAKMPQVEIVDMREELEKGNRSIFSNKLYEEIKINLEKKNQIILFLNRRGFSTFVSCRKCGFVFKCSSCDIALTYHNENNSLVCHYCGKKEVLKSICPSCGSKYVKYFGVGTEKIEQEIKKCFPQAETIRMDFDTTRKKNAYEDIYTAFKNKRADVLIGTQMIAKGLDFKDVTLVGVIAADLSLNLPDYRSSEKTFQLITQVSGRAGRGEKEGKVIVQTYNPDDFSIQNSACNNYEKFFDEEIKIRRSMDYPPFTRILVINMSSKNENLLIKSIQNVGINLKTVLENNDNITILGPCPCQISKIKDLYRWQILLKGNVDNELGGKIKYTVYNLLKEVYNDVRVSIDINPNSLL